MKVAFVTVRYGDVIGGAEYACKQTAEYLTEKGWEVHVYTTNALDYRTWLGKLPCGKQQINGVHVHRFPVRLPRYRYLFAAYKLLSHWLLRQNLLAPRLAAVLERVWLFLQGPYCPALSRAIKASAAEYQRVFFFTYLYAPSYTLHSLEKKAVLIPNAHPEPPFFFPQVSKLLNACHTLFANSHAEADLLRAHSKTPIEVVGTGLETRLRVRQLAATPLVLCLGRLCEGKGLGLLCRAFVAQPAAATTLLLAGELEPDFRLPEHPQIQYLGKVTETEKNELLAQAWVLVNPSPHESMSLVVLEALAWACPVLVNGNSPVLADYARKHPSVLAFSDEADLQTQLTKMCVPDWQAQQAPAAAQSATQIQREYSWERVLAAYTRAC